MSDAAIIAIAIAFGTALVSAVGGCIYFGRVAFVALQGKADSDVNATKAAAEITAANISIATMSATLKTAQARNIELEKKVTDASIVPVGGGLDALRGDAAGSDVVMSAVNPTSNKGG